MCVCVRVEMVCVCGVRRRQEEETMKVMRLQRRCSAVFLLLRVHVGVGRDDDSLLHASLRGAASHHLRDVGGRGGDRRAAGRLRGHGGGHGGAVFVLL